MISSHDPVRDGPRGGEKMTFTDLSIDDLNDPVGLILKSFFTQSGASQASGRAYLERLDLAVECDAPMTLEAATHQLRAIREWGQVPTTDRYLMLRAIAQPALIVHGTQDIVVDAVNAFILGERLSDARLLMLPDASHGAQSQHADVFLANARLFLNS